MWRLASGPRARTLAIAAALFAAVFALRMTTDAAGTGVGFLYVVPIVMLAVEFGRRGGRGRGARGDRRCSRSGRRPRRPSTVDAVGYLSRATVFLLVGLGDRADGGAAPTARPSGWRRARATSRCRATSSAPRASTATSSISTARWEEELGWTREELMARPFLEFVHPDDRELTARERARRASSRRRSRTATGRRRATTAASSGRRRPTLEHGLIHASARDVTDRVAAEKAAKVAEERFQRAFKDSAVGMAVVGVFGPKANLILDANDSLAEMIGMPVEELIGTPTLAELADPEDVERITQGMLALHDGEHGPVPLRVPHQAAGRQAALGGPHDLARPRRRRHAALPALPDRGHRRAQARRRGAPAPRGPRRAQRRVQPPPLRAGARARARPTRPPAAGAARCSCWTWTASRASTTRSGTPPATP